MQQEWDSIDNLIKDSLEDMSIDENYNARLMQKVRKNNHIEYHHSNTAAISFIFSGVLMLFIFTSNIQYKIIDIGYRVKTDMLSIQYSYKADIVKNILGSDFYGEKK